MKQTKQIKYTVDIENKTRTFYIDLLYFIYKNNDYTVHYCSNIQNCKPTDKSFP